MHKQSKNQSKKKNGGKTKKGFKSVAVPAARSISWSSPTPKGHVESGVEKFANLPGTEYKTPGTLCVDKIMSVNMPELPRLAAFGPLYSRYRVNTLSFEIINFAPSTASGEYAIVYEPDSQVTWSTMTTDQVLARVFASAHKLIMNVAPGRHNFRVPVDHIKKYDYATSDTEDRLSKFGRVLVVNLSNIAANNLLATVHCSYSIAFSEPTVPSAGATSAWRTAFATFLNNAALQSVTFGTDLASDFLNVVMAQGRRMISAGLESAVRATLNSALAPEAGKYVIRTLPGKTNLEDRRVFVFGPGLWTVEAGIQFSWDGPTAFTLHLDHEDASLKVGPKIYLTSETPETILSDSVINRPFIPLIDEVGVGYGYSDCVHRINFVVPHGTTDGLLVDCYCSVNNAEYSGYLANQSANGEAVFYVNVASHDMGSQLSASATVRDPGLGYSMMPTGLIMGQAPQNGSSFTLDSFKGQRESKELPGPSAPRPSPQTLVLNDEWTRVQPIASGSATPQVVASAALKPTRK